MSLCAATIIALAGCGAPDEPDHAAPFHRLELASEGDPLQYSELELVKGWKDFADRKTWSSWDFHGAKHKVVAFEDQPFLRIVRKKDVLVDIPVKAELGHHTFLTLCFVLRVEPTRMAAELYREGQRIAVDQQHVKDSLRLQRVSFRFASAAGELGEIDRIVLRIRKGTEPTGLRSIVLEEGSPPTTLDPQISGAFDLVTIEGDARRATFISQASAWETAFDIPGPRREFCFSYAQPDAVRLPGQQPELHVSLEYPDGRKDERVLKITREPGQPTRWRHESLELKGAVGERVTATFRLHSDDGEGLAAIGQPFLVRRRDEAETVLLITSDTHRADHVGFLCEEGGVVTETIDRLAAAGVSFVDAQSTVNNTTPSHVSMFTGLSPRDTGMVFNVSRLSEDAPTLAEAFHDAGYATLASVSATPVNFNFCGLDQGFDRYSIPNRTDVRDARGTVDQVLEWLPHYQGVPLFLWVHLFDAHGPYEPPEELERRYYPVEADPFDASAPGAQPQLAPYWNESIVDPDYTEALYKGEITDLDQQLGRLLSVDRIWDGVIAFTADHGEQLRHGNGRPFDHEILSLEILAVPLILKAPGLAPGIRRDDPVQQVDIGRTLLNLTEHRHVEFPGRDLLEERVEVGEPRFAIESNGFAAAVLTDRWMLVLQLHAKSEEEVKEEYHRVRLYDLPVDPHCLFDVREEHPEVTRKYRRLLIGWLGRSAGHNWRGAATVAEDDIAGRLAALGYAAVPETDVVEWFDPECSCNWCRKFE